MASLEDSFIDNYEFMPKYVKIIHNQSKVHPTRNNNGHKFMHLYEFIAVKFKEKDTAESHSVWKYYGKLLKYLQIENAGLLLYIKVKDEENNRSTSDEIINLCSNTQETVDSNELSAKNMNENNLSFNKYQRNNECNFRYKVEPGAGNHFENENEDDENKKSQVNNVKEIRKKYELLTKSNEPIQTLSSLKLNAISSDYGKKRSNYCLPLLLLSPSRNDKCEKKNSPAKDSFLLPKKSILKKTRAIDPELNTDETNHYKTTNFGLANIQINKPNSDQDQLINDLSFRSKRNFFELKASGKCLNSNV